MHPSGIKFGLSQGLLELNGNDLVVSSPFRERISELARHWVRRRKRVLCIWDFVVTNALHDMPYSLEGARPRDYVPFYTGLDRAVLQSMMPIAEEVGMGHRWLQRHFDSEGVREQLHKDTRRCSASGRNGYWRLHFRKIYTVVIGLCKENAPLHLRHAELLALCELNHWMTPRELKRMDEFSKQLFSEEFRKRIGWD
jgi:hypothetical protein